MLKAIFYARFHPERGPSIIHQYPNGSVIKSLTTTANPPLFSYSDISAYIIPPYELCNRAFSICSKGQRVLGFPVSLEDPKYERNRFTFNVCFVVDERSEDARAWERIVRKTSAFFTSLEEEDGLLSAEEKLEGLKWAGEESYPISNIGIVYPLLQSIAEDLNAYHESCICISAQHVLNLRFESTNPTKPPPPPVQSWAVPLLIRSLPSPSDWTWDLTLRRIHPHIDGIKHIALIAIAADVEPKLVKRAVRELLHHDRAILLDIFHFQAIYALTPAFAYFAQDDAMQEECRAYVGILPSTNPFASGAKQAEGSPSNQPSKSTLITLYTSLGPGLSVHDFLLTHRTQLSAIDIRRFITFGTIKGFLRRIHKHPLAISPSAAGSTTTTAAGFSTSTPSPTKSKPRSNEDAARASDRAWKKAALSSGWATPPPPAELAPQAVVGSSKSTEEVRGEEDERLRGFLDGRHCLDEACVAMRVGEANVMERLRGGRCGEVVVVCK